MGQIMNCDSFQMKTLTQNCSDEELELGKGVNTPNKKPFTSLSIE